MMCVSPCALPSVLPSVLACVEGPTHPHFQLTRAVDAQRGFHHLCFFYDLVPLYTGESDFSAMTVSVQGHSLSYELLDALRHNSGPLKLHPNRSLVEQVAAGNVRFTACLMIPACTMELARDPEVTLLTSDRLAPPYCATGYPGFDDGSGRAPKCHAEYTAPKWHTPHGSSSGQDGALECNEQAPSI